MLVFSTVLFESFAFNPYIATITTFFYQDLRSDSNSSSENDDIRENVDCVKASNNESSSSSDSDDCPILMKMSKKDRESVEMIDSSSSSSSEDESIKNQEQGQICNFI